MKLEEQVCSLDLARKLKELGVKQESQFWWLDEQLIDKDEITLHSVRKDYQDVFSAFTVAELGEMLPFATDTSKRTMHDQPRWFCISPINRVETARREADARAKMLIYLLENLAKQLPSIRKEAE